MCKPKTIRTPFGDVTLLPITQDDMEKMKQSLLANPELDLELEDECCKGEWWIVPIGKECCKDADR